MDFKTSYLRRFIKGVRNGKVFPAAYDRTEHLKWFVEDLIGFAKNVIMLRGGMGAIQHKALAGQIKAVPDSKERVIIATGRYIGEGFDDARLDTLFLAMPIS